MALPRILRRFAKGRPSARRRRPSLPLAKAASLSSLIAIKRKPTAPLFCARATAVVQSAGGRNILVRGSSRPHGPHLPNSQPSRPFRLGWGSSAALEGSREGGRGVIAGGRQSFGASHSSRALTQGRWFVLTSPMDCAAPTPSPLQFCASGALRAVACI